MASNIIGKFVTGDLCEIEALMAIESEFDFEFDEHNPKPESTMLDFVQLIERMRKPS